MKNNIKPFLTELIWITFALVLTILLSSLLFGWTFVTGELYLHFHDTYFVISRWLILTPLFCLLTFFIYFFKEKREMFSRTFPNWIFIISGFTLVLTLTFLIKSFSEGVGALTGGWTAYPPLSQLKDLEPKLTENPLIKFIANFLTVIQVIILFLSFYGTYRSGQKTKSNSD